MKNNELKSPKATAGDVLHALAKGAVSGVPIAGGLAAEFFGLVIAPPLSKRRDEWFESLANQLRELRVDFDQLSQNQEFITTAMHATQAAIRSHDREKLDALRNAVTNTAIGNAPEQDLRSLFLSFVEEFTPSHLRILKLLENRNDNLPLLRSFIEQREMTDQMVLGLARNGLIDDTRPYAARGRDTGESLLTFGWTISKLGKWFLAFISEKR